MRAVIIETIFLFLVILGLLIWYFFFSGETPGRESEIDFAEIYFQGLAAYDAELMVSAYNDEYKPKIHNLQQWLQARDRINIELLRWEKLEEIKYRDSTFVVYRLHLTLQGRPVTESRILWLDNKRKIIRVE